MGPSRSRFSLCRAVVFSAVLLNGAGFGLTALPSAYAEEFYSSPLPIDDFAGEGMPTPTPSSYGEVLKTPDPLIGTVAIAIDELFKKPVKIEISKIETPRLCVEFRDYTPLGYEMTINRGPEETVISLPATHPDTWTGEIDHRVTAIGISYYAKGKDGKIHEMYASLEGDVASKTSHELKWYEILARATILLPPLPPPEDK